MLNKKTTNATLLLLFVLFASARNSFAGLLVAPTRVVLTDEQRVTTVALRHIGNKEGKYRITPIFNRMRPDGSMEEVKEVKSISAEERSALKYIRYSPRLAVLTPNVEQIARIMVVAPKSLPDGEYRIHLLFEPTEDTEGEIIGKKPEEKGKDAIGMKLEARMSVAIPVTYRHGKTSFDVKISNLKLVQMADRSLGFSVDMDSTGNGFARGDFEAYFTPSGGKPVQVALVRGIPSYRKQRSFSTSLTVPPDVKFRKGTLRVEFHEAEEGGQAGKILSTIEGNVP